MKLYVEHADRIVAPDDPNDLLALVRRVNPLAGELAVDDDIGAKRIVTWSGTLGPDLFTAHPANWLRPGHDSLRDVCRSLAPRLSERSMTVCFHPHCRHVLSDAPSCVTFLNDLAGEPFEIALAPASMLEPSMMVDLDDHLRRIFEALGPRAAAVFMSDVTEGADGLIEAVPLGQGKLPRETVIRLLGDHVPRGTPVIVIDRDLDAQRDWLELDTPEGLSC